MNRHLVSPHWNFHLHGLHQSRMSILSSTLHRSYSVPHFRRDAQDTPPMSLTCSHALAHPGGLPIMRLTNGERHWGALLLSLQSERLKNPISFWSCGSQERGRYHHFFLLVFTQVQVAAAAQWPSTLMVTCSQPEDAPEPGGLYIHHDVITQKRLYMAA